VKFRTTLLLALAGLAITILAMIVGAITLVVTRAARRDVAEDLARGGEAVEQFISYRRSLYEAQSRVVAGEPKLRAIVVTLGIDHASALDVAQHVQADVGCARLVLTDARGRLIADVTSSQRSGDDLSSDPLVAGALSDPAGGSSAIVVDDGQPFQMQGRRMSFDDQPVGVVVIGYPIDDHAAEDYLHQTTSPLALLVGGRLVATSALPDDPGIERSTLESALVSLPATDGPVEVQLGGSRYLALAAPLPGYTGAPSLEFVVLRSLDRALAPERSLIRVLVALAALALLAALVAAVAIARRLSRPIDQLVSFTDRIGRGALDARVNVQGVSEVTTLADSMNRMAAKLAELQREQATRERLEQELEIASRIQTSILPRSLGVPGLEMAARMIPATEVGGDYYDVLAAEDGCWIAIGDVAGHGLDAGLIMLMVQSAVAAIGRATPDATPRDAVLWLNDMLYENVHTRLARSEHVTLTLLRVHNDGSVVFAGAHEDILVWRKRAQKSELVTTGGTWVGMTGDIAGVTTDTSIALEPGDVVVLHTDGVTQTENPRGEQFGLDRVVSEVERTSDRPVEEVRDAILTAAGRFGERQDDDRTVLVLRYLGGEAGRGPATASTIR
jgi:sigma-B regulation protein RsbU (phosphoserine phosphatase)